MKAWRQIEFMRLYVKIVEGGEGLEVMLRLEKIGLWSEVEVTVWKIDGLKFILKKFVMFIKYYFCNAKMQYSMENIKIFKSFNKHFLASSHRFREISVRNI